MYRFRPGLALALAVGIPLQPAPLAGPAEAFELVEPAKDQTVSVVIGSGQLIRVDQEFSSLFVANPAVADIEVKSPRLLYLTGVGVGETTLFAVDENDNVLMSAVIKVTHNVGALQEGIARVAPGRSVQAATVDQSLVLTGTVADAEQAANVVQVAAQFVDDPARVINHMDVAAPTQVNLQVRIAEVGRNVDRRLGIRWGALGINSTGTTKWGFVGGSGVPDGYSASIGYSGPRLNVDVVLEALSEEGLVTILAEPNLTARSGEPASFLAGGEFPYSVVNDDENTIEFKDFGIGLNFTPTVLDGNRISLKVATEVSELDYQNVVSLQNQVPSLKTRRAETTVDLGSGQTFAIAGLMQQSSTQNSAKMPAMGEIPILGALFRSNNYKRGQTELVILVTPVIVGPQSGPRRVATPTDTYVPPNDFERILLGRFEGSSTNVTRVRNRLGARRLHGASGFVFE